jgi:hypothetical protein
MSDEASGGYALTPPEISDELREHALVLAFEKAAEACNVQRAESKSLAAHCKAILRAAKGANLEPHLYQIVYMVGKWAAAKGA